MEAKLAYLLATMMTPTLIGIARAPKLTRPRKAAQAARVGAFLKRMMPNHPMLND